MTRITDDHHDRWTRHLAGIAVSALILTGPAAVGETPGNEDIEEGEPSLPAALYAYEDLGTLGGPNSVALAMSGRGSVVGWSEIDHDQQAIAAGIMAVHHAFLWRDGEMSDLGTLGGLNSEARAVNGRDQVVGSSQTASGERRAFYSYGGAMFDLNDLLRDRFTASATPPDRSGLPDQPDADPAPRPVLLWANAINHEGHIVACGTMGDDQRIRGYLLMPVDALQLTLPEYDYIDLSLLSPGVVPPLIGEDFPDTPVAAGNGNRFAHSPDEDLPPLQPRAPREVPPFIGGDFPDTPIAAPGDVVYGPDDEDRTPRLMDRILEQWDTVRPGDSLRDLLDALVHYSSQDHVQQIQAPNDQRFAQAPPVKRPRFSVPVSGGQDSGDQADRRPYGRNQSDDGETTDDPEPGLDCSALGINEHDQIVGAIGQTAVVWESFQADVLESDRALSQANAINDFSEIVGWISDAMGQPAAAMWFDGKRRVLFSSTGWISEARDISNLGEVVGWAEHEAIGADPVAMLWIGRDATDLNTVTDIPLSAEGSVRLEEASAVDDTGRIAGYGRLPNGEVRAFVLTPTD